MKKTTLIRTLSVLAIGGIVLWGAKSLAGGEMHIQHKAVCRAILGTGEVRNTPEGTGDIALVNQTETSHNVWVPDAGVATFSGGYDTDKCTFSCRAGYQWKNNGCEEVVTQYPDCDTPDITIGSYTIAACNVGATQAWTGDSSSRQNSYGCHFQQGNNYCFMGYLAATGITVTGTQINAVGYGPSNPYSSSTRITDYQRESSNNRDLWGDITNTQEARRGPCSMGYHVPSYEEWKGIIKAGFDEGKWSGTPNGSFTSWNWDTIGLTEFQKTLKLPRSGTRHYSPPVVSYQNSYGDYWSSSLDTYPYGAKYLEFNENGGGLRTNTRSYGFTVRCFKNS